MIDYSLITTGLFLAVGVCAGITMFGIFIFLLFWFFGRD